MARASVVEHGRREPGHGAPHTGETDGLCLVRRWLVGMGEMTEGGGGVVGLWVGRGVGVAWRTFWRYFPGSWMRGKLESWRRAVVLVLVARKRAGGGRGVAVGGHVEHADHGVVGGGGGVVGVAGHQGGLAVVGGAAVLVVGHSGDREVGLEAWRHVEAVGCDVDLIALLEKVMILVLYVVVPGAVLVDVVVVFSTISLGAVWSHAT